jgi:hypothetical protein
MNKTVTETQAKQRSDALVVALVGRDYSDLWWNSENREFSGKTPREQWQIDYTTVYNYLMTHGAR